MNAKKAIEKANKIKSKLAKKYLVNESDVIWKGEDKYIVMRDGMQIEVTMPDKVYKYEIRQIDAWNSPDGWYWNTSYLIGTMTTKAEDHRRAFRHWLAARNITFSVSTSCEDEGILTIYARKTGEPLIAAIPMF